MAEIQVKQVFEYKDRSGKTPYREWVDSFQDTHVRFTIAARIARLRAGLAGHSRSLGDGINELKIDLGPGYRIYFGMDGDKLVILLCGGDKSTQKKDIQTAKEYWVDYLSRK